jgi:hypothetical protein
MNSIIEEQILPYPYFQYFNVFDARAVKEKNENGTRVRWFNLETGEELPPYFGCGEDAGEQICRWLLENGK